MGAQTWLENHFQQGYDVVEILDTFSLRNTSDLTPVQTEFVRDLLKESTRLYLKRTFFHDSDSPDVLGYI